MNLPVPPRWARRLGLPVVVAVQLAAAGVLAVVTLLAVPVSAVTRRNRAARVAAFGCVYLAMDMWVVAGCGWYWLRAAGRRPAWWVQAHATLLRAALTLVLGAARRLLGFRVELIEPPDTAPLTGEAPVLVLARHSGPGDSFALVHLLLERYGRRPRIVAKELLALDPALDLVLGRLGAVWVGRGPLGSAQALSSAVAGLGPHDALLLFPEGENWTPERQQQARAGTGRRRARKTMALARQLDHVLPPRSSGALACLDRRPDLEVVMMAHAGLDRLATVRQVWARLPFATPMTVRWWRAGRPPTPGDRDAGEQWLVTEWAVVDEWVSLHADRDRRPEQFDPGRRPGG